MCLSRLHLQTSVQVSTHRRCKMNQISRQARKQKYNQKMKSMQQQLNKIMMVTPSCMEMSIQVAIGYIQNKTTLLVKSDTQTLDKGTPTISHHNIVNINANK
mmetsp:Transcript_30263/g.78479  ORF Transcript_30263/g.78479 Transcript_30263/m.78479 type:complete len:102 (+) Transcript_30263:13-318(+)